MTARSLAAFLLYSIVGALIGLLVACAAYWTLLPIAAVRAALTGGD